jgi:hypothetical protein
MKIVKMLFANASTVFLTIFLILFSFGQLQRLQISNQLAFYGHDAVVVGFLIWRFITSQKISQAIKKLPAILKKLFVSHRLELFWLMWLIAGMILGTATNRVDLKSFLYLGRLVIYLLFAYLISSDRRLTYSVRSGLVVTGSLIGLWGLLQYLFLPDTRFLFLYGWDVHYYRLISTFFDPAFTGMALVLTFGLWQDKQILLSMPAKLKQVIQLLLVVAIAATFSRASYIALFVVTSVQTLTKKIKLNFLVPILIVFAATIWLLPKPGGEGVNLARTSTGEARLINSQQALEKLQGGQWLWGRGLFNNDVRQAYETPSHAQLPDSLPILVLNSTGLVGLLLSAILLWKRGGKWWQQDPLWTTLFIAVLVHSLFNNTLLQPFILLILWSGKNYLINKN